MTFLTLFGALLVKFRSGFQSTGAVREGYSDDMVEAGLVGTAALVGIFGLFIVVSEIGAKAARSMLEQQVTAPVLNAAAWVRATACCRKCRRRAAALCAAAPGKRSGATAAHSVGDDAVPKVAQWAGPALPHNTQTTVTPLHHAGGGGGAAAAARGARNPATAGHGGAIVAGGAGATGTTAAAV